MTRLPEPGRARDDSAAMLDAFAASDTERRGRRVAGSPGSCRGTTTSGAGTADTRFVRNRAMVPGDLGDRTQSIGGFGRLVYRW